MSKVYADKIEPRDSSMDVTIGTSTNTVTLAGNDLRANTVKDSGGNTLWTSDGSGNLSSVNSALTGNLKLLTTQTASGSSSLSFTTLIDSTYDVYIFKFIEINPTADGEIFQFQVNASGQTGFNETITSTMLKAYHYETDAAALAYEDDHDQHAGTGYQKLTTSIGSAADENASGELYLFGPSSTTYVKHFYARINQYASSVYSGDVITAGIINITSAITEIDFKITTGNFDGTIKMYGLL